MRSLSLLFFFCLAASMALSLNYHDKITLFYQWELECDAFHQGKVYSSEIDIWQKNDKTLSITPKDWLNNNGLECVPLKYSPGIASDASLTTLLGRDLMPMVSKEDDLINLYNCSFPNETTETIFVVNGVDVLTLPYRPRRLPS
jgi:hypothetical protein